MKNIFLKPKRIKTPVYSGGFATRGLVVSPYYPRVRGTNITTMKAVIVGLTPNGAMPAAVVSLWDGSGNFISTFVEPVILSSTDVTSDQFKADIITGVIAGIISDYSVTLLSSEISFLSGLLNNRSFNYPSLAVNTSRQVSTIQDTVISASVDITAALSLSGGTSGKVELKYADDSAFTTNVKTVQGSANGNTGTLALGLGITQLCTATVTGTVPAGKYYRLVTTNVTGTPTYGTPIIQEVLL